MRRQVHVLLDVAERDGRSLGQATDERASLIGERIGLVDPRDQADRRCLGRIQHRREHQQFLGLRRSDQLGQEVARSIVAAQPDLRECDRETRIRDSKPEIAGHRHAQAGAGGGAGNHGNRRLGHFMQQARCIGSVAQARHPLLEAHRGVAAGRHRFHIATGAERTTGAREDDRPDGRIGLCLSQGLEQQCRHLETQRIARIGSIHREREHAVAQIDEQVWGGHVGYLLSNRMAGT
ncbi:MAG: hypothetical protein R3E48_14960 [Burkholderiaceae bacterium]